jgi:hypothetical protein
VAIKFEAQGSPHPLLRHEYKVYRELRDCIGFCNIYYFGIQGPYNVMVMDLLGLSLHDLLVKCGGKRTNVDCFELIFVDYDVSGRK